MEDEDKDMAVDDDVDDMTTTDRPQSCAEGANSSGNLRDNDLEILSLKMFPSLHMQAAVQTAKQKCNQTQSKKRTELPGPSSKDDDQPPICAPLKAKGDLESAGLGLSRAPNRNRRKRKISMTITPDTNPKFSPESKVLSSTTTTQNPISEYYEVGTPTPPPVTDAIPSTSGLQLRLQSQSGCRYVIPSKVIGTTVQTTKMELITNYLRLKIKPLVIYRYDVAFRPANQRKFWPQAFKTFKNNNFQNHIIMFDQAKFCFSVERLSVVPAQGRFAKNVPITYESGKTNMFEVSLKAAGAIDLKRLLHFMDENTSSLTPPSDAVQALDIILRHATSESAVEANWIFYKRPSRPIDLGEGLEMWTGLFQSAIFTSSAFVNVDVVHRGFPKQQNLAEAISSGFQLDLNLPIENQIEKKENIIKLENFIQHLQVNATRIHPDGTVQKYNFTCNQLVRPPKSQFFELKTPTGESRKISVADYFLHIKKYRIKYPFFNCIWVGAKEKSIYYPVELLEVAYGQSKKDFQENKMLKDAATSPIERKRKIEDVIKAVNYPQNKYIKMYGMDIDDKFLPIKAKILQPPKLNVGAREPVVPRNGSWIAERFFKAEPLTSWAIIAVETTTVKQFYVQEIIKLITEIGSKSGMRVIPPKCVMLNIVIHQLHNVMSKKLKGINYVFVIISEKNHIYDMVKVEAERNVGILTQCLTEKILLKPTILLKPIVRNMLYKTNTKLMGINQILDKSSIPKCLIGANVMIIGADVTHPTNLQPRIPSIAAVTASMDDKYFSYSIELCIQAPKLEIIVNFEDMLVNHLMMYKKKQGKLPTKIFVFRDGVSQGQFGMVLDRELTAVYNAYRRMTGTNVKPEVLFVIVIKRHHTRFFEANNYGNVQPGTVVDTQIVHARELDFFLVSHKADKGTAKPTRYHTVRNDGRIPSDEVEQLTYYLCHLFSRCMRSVSYPTPTYYAHLACLRARSLTYGLTHDLEALEREPQRLKVMTSLIQQSPMFYV